MLLDPAPRSDGGYEACLRWSRVELLCEAEDVQREGPRGTDDWCCDQS